MLIRIINTPHFVCLVVMRAGFEETRRQAGISPPHARTSKLVSCYSFRFLSLYSFSVQIAGNQCR